MALMTPTVPSSRRSSLRPTVIGWVAWCLFIVSVFVVSTNAGRDRYTGVCPGPGEGGRDWVFELFPFVQLDSALQPPGAGGVNVGLVWGAAVALGLATAVTVIVFVFVSLVNLGRAHSEARQ